MEYYTKHELADYVILHKKELATTPNFSNLSTFFGWRMLGPEKTMEIGRTSLHCDKYEKSYAWGASEDFFPNIDLSQ